MSARGDRIRLLADFLRDCERGKVVASRQRLVEWLDANQARPKLGRPRADPVLKIERLCLVLDREDLERLVERLSAALGTEAAA